MSIFWGLEHFTPPEGGVAVTLGTFDGVHLGHQALLRRLKEAGQEHGLNTVAVTFDRHPLDTVSPGHTPPLLNTSRERVDRLAAYKPGRVLVLVFDEHFARLDARRFVRQVLVERIGVRHIVVGENFRFGWMREGVPDLLQEMGEELGFRVDVLPPVEVHGRAVSSSLIRRTLQEGDVRRAADYLGGCYRIRGTVVHGDARGRQLGYPTANLDVPAERLMPARGIYAVNGRFNGLQLRGAANIGTRPTLGGGPLALEVHLVGFDGDLYGRELEVQFLERLREERRFESVEALVEQIQEDVHRSLQTPDCTAHSELEEMITSRAD